MKRILIVEDDVPIREVLAKFLISENYEVEEAGSILEMREKLENEKYDMILLDIMLPDGFSIDELPEIKINYPEIGIIIISARDSDIDKIYGLEIGADDYITKPFNPREVIARIKAYFRRTSNTGEILRFGNLKIYCDNYIVKIGDKEVELTSKEFEILCLLAKNSNKVFSRDEIIKRVWEDEFISDRAVDVHISNLRDKIGKHWIVTVRGMGYRFNTRGYDV
ncbi:response regulator transcription factor [Thermosipho atlanticus]|uniref:Two-component system, OmpR family, response regulator n=1 Tax=Thermosipho atlanticus DSM 15807 TaxID=1123380 RepID=A0A1M5TKN6_9BACT|nr:response regulator transcription factor [Thermosipho atlanticus]SHH51249.1 two-component system, OmpR family, response regulator [Thermosipho atlanticus DSM 15807]